MSGTFRACDAVIDVEEESINPSNEPLNEPLNKPFIEPDTSKDPVISTDPEYDEFEAVTCKILLE